LPVNVLLSARHGEVPFGLTELFSIKFEAQVGKRTSTDSTFVLHKEKEMNFRRCILAMVMLALCVGLASAQVIVGTPTATPAGPLQCTANVAVPNTLRSEGMTELIGDIVIQCTGGAALAVGATIPTANITVSLATNVTSRLLGGSGSATVPSNTSEALLLIDEPNTALAGGLGPGPAAPFSVCANSAVGASAGGCAQTVAAGTVTGAGSIGVASPGTNVFQGLVTANQVAFLGIPILPPSTTGLARVFRITNVRANVSALGGGGLAGTTPLFASITISGSASLPVSNPVPIAGFIQSGLSTALRRLDAGGSLTVPNLAQCGGSSNPQALAVLRFSENFATAFKTRVTPIPPETGQGTGPGQNVPGQVNNASESGLITGVNGGTAGLADYGTRLKAVFNNVPAGVRLWVSINNIASLNSGNSGGTPVGASASSARLVLSETAPEGQTAASTTTIGSGGSALPAAELTVVNGTATAVWEVFTTNKDAIETDAYQFGVWQQFTANPGANSPPTGTATVNMSFAPTPTAAFSASSGGAASSTLTIPRFADTSSGANIFRIALCQTVLLFPFVTNIAGFDTGIAIANTTTDPFGTRVQNGTCSLNFYGTAAPPAVTTPNIATATVFTTLASTAAAGFNGYMIAVCNFQLAHGFAFISDLGARNLAMGYLALVVQGDTDDRNNTLESLGH
jgi:hypothetical protein